MKRKKVETVTLTVIVFIVTACLGFAVLRTSARNVTLSIGESPDVSEKAVQPDPTVLGAEIFKGKCSACHHHDKTDDKMGPGLKGFSKMDSMPVSKWPLREESIRKQLKTPFKNMPAFGNLPEVEIQQLLIFLKTL